MKIENLLIAAVSAGVFYWWIYPIVKTLFERIGL